jgi:predicted CoA-binding protein
MGVAEEVLSRSNTVVVIDWPSQEVPMALAAAGYRTFSHEGPGDDAWFLYEGEKRTHASGPPESADLVYTYRPCDELPGIVEFAKTLGARAIWFEAGRRDPQEAARARPIVEAAGLQYLDEPYIVDELRARRP